MRKVCLCHKMTVSSFCPIHGAPRETPTAQRESATKGQAASTPIPWLVITSEKTVMPMIVSPVKSNGNRDKVALFPMMMPKEIAEAKAWVFAHVHDTPIVPPGHCAHPHELIKRGWKPSDSEKSPISISIWPQGTHFYATVGGETVQDGNGNEKWNTYEQAFNAAVNFRTLL